LWFAAQCAALRPDGSGSGNGKLFQNLFAFFVFIQNSSLKINKNQRLEESSGKKEALKKACHEPSL
jgi:hypothetical protein